MKTSVIKVTLSYDAAVVNSGTIVDAIEGAGFMPRAA